MARGAAGAHPAPACGVCVCGGVGCRGGGSGRGKGRTARRAEGERGAPGRALTCDRPAWPGSEPSARV